MVVTTRISVPECLTLLERREPGPCGGPSSVRIRCTLSRAYSSRKLGAGGMAVPDDRRNDFDGDGRRHGGTDERTFFVYDSSTFLRYGDTRRALRGMLASVPLLRGVVDMSPAAAEDDSWDSQGALEGAAAAMLRWARQDDDAGRLGGHYHFRVVVAVRVSVVYSEPKAAVRACAETVMQTVEEHCSETPAPRR
ncbi:hypothetical protein ACP4OV_010967 [Aristida adscensionis]